MNKAASVGLSLLSCLLGSSSFAQSWQAQGYDHQAMAFGQERAAPIGIFARYLFQPTTSRTVEAWQMGISLAPKRYSERTALGFQQGEPQQRIPLEIRIGSHGPSLWSAGSNGRLIANLSGKQTILGAHETNLTTKEGVGNVLMIGGAIVGVIVLAAALSPDKEPLLCTGNTVPNPIAGTCEPLR